MASRSMTEAVFLVLTALVDRPRHGYGIAREVTDLSEGRLSLSVGTLYGVLDRLVADGLVELDHEEVRQGRLRRYYRLTESGEEALVAATERLAANVRVAGEKLRARRAVPARVRPATSGGTA